jgi:hypothetical protein
MIWFNEQIAECETDVIKRKELFQTQSIMMTVADTDYKMSYHVNINSAVDTNLKAS